MESSRLPPTKATMVQAAQGPTPSDATATTTTNDAKHDVGSGAEPNEQYAMGRTREPVVATGKQWVLTIRREERE